MYEDLIRYNNPWRSNEQRDTSFRERLLYTVRSCPRYGITRSRLLRMYRSHHAQRILDQLLADGLVVQVGSRLHLGTGLCPTCGQGTPLQPGEEVKQ